MTGWGQEPGAVLIWDLSFNSGEDGYATIDDAANDSLDDDNDDDYDSYDGDDASGDDND